VKGEGRHGTWLTAGSQATIKRSEIMACYYYFFFKSPPAGSHRHKTKQGVYNGNHHYLFIIIIILYSMVTHCIGQSHYCERESTDRVQTPPKLKEIPSTVPVHSRSGSAYEQLLLSSSLYRCASKLYRCAAPDCKRLAYNFKKLPRHVSGTHKSNPLFTSTRSAPLIRFHDFGAI